MFTSTGLSMPHFLPKGDKQKKYPKLPKSGSIITGRIPKKNTTRAYKSLISKFCIEWGDYEIGQLSVDDVLTFLDQLTDGCKPQTKRLRFARLCSFFNFIKNNINADFTNPCDSSMLRKLFRPAVTVNWDIVEKETVDEIIFRTAKIRNRIMLELMARGAQIET